MTKTEQRRINRQVRTLRADRKAWLTGKHLHWGTPWCGGPGALGHQEPVCEGCATVAWCRDRAAEVTEKIGHLEALLAPVVQGALW
jgi:hypothetical protein